MTPKTRAKLEARIAELDAKIKRSTDKGVKRSKRRGQLRSSSREAAAEETKMPKKIQWYVTEDGVNLYDVFRAGIRFGRNHPNNNWTEDDWYEALEAALPAEFLTKLKAAAVEV